MSSARPFSLLFVLLLSFSVQAQQTQTGTPQPPAPPATQDPQAVIVINQAVMAAGGAQALIAVADYTANGNITFHRADNNVQGTVKVLGSGFSNLRVDATLPVGLLSESISQGQTMIGSSTSVKQLHAQAPLNPARFVLPFLQLRTLVSNPRYQLTYKGLVEVNGNSVHDIQVLHFLAGIPNPPDLLRKYNTIDIFIDPTTYQVVMTQDFVFGSRGSYSVRQIQYSNYQTVNGVLVPFTIDEQLDGHPNRLIQLNAITFNSGLQDSDFVIADAAPKN